MNEISTGLLQEIKTNFPDLSWKSSKYISVGFDNYVIILDNKIVFRIPKNDYSKKILKDEIKLLKQLAGKISSKIPSYTFIAKNCAGYPIIKGEKLKLPTLMIAKQIAEFLTELHSVKISAPERFELKEFKKLQKDAKKILPGHNFDSFFSELKIIFKTPHNKVLIHGDFSPDNIIIKNGKLAGVIDFTDRAIHDPAFDFIFLWDFGREFVEAVHAHYKGEKTGILERSKSYSEARKIWKMLESEKYGVDENGFIQTDANLNKIQLEFKKPLQEITAEIINKFGDKIHSLYLGGSVATGKAQIKKSDLDLILVLKKHSTTQDSLRFNYPKTFRDVGISVTNLSEIKKDPFGWGCLLKHLCVCLYGEDLGKKLAKFKPTKKVAKAFNGDLGKLIKSCLQKPEKDKIHSIMRKIVRTGFSLVIEEEKSWTTDLKKSYEVFSKYYPEKSTEMKQALKWAQKPPLNMKIAVKFLEDFGTWISKEVEKTL